MLTQAERDEFWRLFLATCPPPKPDPPDNRRLMHEDTDAELRGDRVRQEMRDGERDKYYRRIHDQD